MSPLHRLGFHWIVGLGLALASAAAADDAPIDVRHADRVGEWQGAPLYRTTLTSPIHRIDRIYRSMEGPLTQTGFALAPGAPGELLWLIGYEATIVSGDARASLSQEFMCHSSVAVNPKLYRRVVPTQLGPREGRMFTLAQGQRVVRFPPGTGIPFLSNQRLELQSQVLNHNIADTTFEVRQRVSIEFVRDAELEAPIVPLTLTGASGLKRLDEGEAGYFGLASDDADASQHGPGCSLGSSANAHHELSDAHGQRFTGHWIVEPGREVNRTLVTNQLSLAADTRLHYAAVHLHPYAESLTLRDLTTGETVIQARGRSASDRIALEEVEHVASAEGIPLYAGHEYELVSVYDNPSGVDQDAMAGVYLYVRAVDVAVDEIRARVARARRAGGAGKPRKARP